MEGYEQIFEQISEQEKIRDQATLELLRLCDILHQAKMADPFEVRMRFTMQLQNMNASVNSAQKAAHFALKYQDMHEDLHSCILEQLERNSMNTRANIMYFIEHLCDMAHRDGHLDVIRMIQRDIFRVVDAVAPGDGSGAANVKVVRRVLGVLQQKNVLTQETVTELDASLKERDTLPDAEGPSNGHGNGLSTSKANGFAKLDRRQIEQRIEEDRERHKRLKESIWGIDGDPEKECEKMFDECSEIGDDDVLLCEEDEAERAKTCKLG